MSHVEVAQTQDLFTALSNGEFDVFLAACRDDLVLTVRGTDPSTTYVSKSEIADWYQSMLSLAGAAVHSEVEVVRVVGSKSIVLLRYSFERDDVEYAFEMVHLCTFRDSLLATWSSYPLRLPNYARALGVQRSVVPQPA